MHWWISTAWVPTGTGRRDLGDGWRDSGNDGKGWLVREQMEMAGWVVEKMGMAG